MNKVILTGRLTKEAELKFTSGKGTPVATFTIAVDSGYGENKETAFVPVVVWNKGAEAVVNYTHKGSKVLVQGKISTRSYDAKDGTKKFVTEVIADNFGGVEFLDNKKTSGENSQTNNEGLEGLSEDPNSDIPF